MGAHNFDLTVYTTKSMQDAYEEAVEQALYEDGHEAYNGTISTTCGVVRSPISATPIREDQTPDGAVSERLHHLNKRDVCEALPIKRVEPPQYRDIGVIEVEARMQVDLIGADAPYEERRVAMTKTFLREVRKALKAGKVFDFVQPTFGSANTKSAIPKGMDLSALDVHQLVMTPEARGLKASTRATSGRTETRYFILSEGQHEMPRWAAGFASQAEARARLPKKFRDSRVQRERYEIVSMTRRVSGEALVTHELSLGERGKTVPVRLKGRLLECTAKAKVTGETGWLFYGWAAS